MLTRSEILEALRKMGYRRMAALKRYCRHYEQSCAGSPKGHGIAAARQSRRAAEVWPRSSSAASQ